MPSALTSIFLPNTANLETQMRAVDESLPELERLGGAAVQESREELRQRRREMLNTLGEYSGTSTDFAAQMGRIESGQRAYEQGVSMDTATQQAQASRMKRQLALMAQTERPREIFGAVKEGLGTVAQVAAPFLGPAGIPVAMAGAALAGNDPGAAGTAVEGIQAGRMARQQDVGLAAESPARLGSEAFQEAIGASDEQRRLWERRRQNGQKLWEI